MEAGGAHTSATADVGHVISVGNSSGLFIQELKKREKKGLLVALTPPVAVWLCVCVCEMYLLLHPQKAGPSTEGAQM